MEGTELLHPECRKSLRAIAAWRFTGVCRWVGSDVMACANRQIQFSEKSKLNFSRKLNFSFFELSPDALHSTSRSVSLRIVYRLRSHSAHTLYSGVCRVCVTMWRRVETSSANFGKSEI